MAKCALGPKKLARLGALLGRPVAAAYVRGGWPHGWAEVHFVGEHYDVRHRPPFTNYHTGEIDEQESWEISRAREALARFSEDGRSGFEPLLTSYVTDDGIVVDLVNVPREE